VLPTCLTLGEVLATIRRTITESSERRLDSDVVQFVRHRRGVLGCHEEAKRKQQPQQQQKWSVSTDQLLIRRTLPTDGLSTNPSSAAAEKLCR